MTRICDSCCNEISCQLWEALYGKGRTADDLKDLFKRTYGLEVKASIEIRKCKGFA